jgi:hypothetical protein
MAGPLAQKIRAKFPGVYDDLDDATLESKILAKHPEYADMAESPKPRGSRIGNIIRLLPTPGGLPAPVADLIGGFVKNEAADIADDPAGALPMVGGQIGSYFGAPGAAAGGGIGRFAANAIKGDPLTEGVAGDAAMQGAINAIPLAGKPLIKAGTAFYRKTLAPVASDLAKIAKSNAIPALDAAANKLAETGISRRIPISRGGVRKADRLITELDDAGRGLVTDAAKAGATVNPADIRKETYSHLRGRFGPQAQTFAEGDMAAARQKAAEFSRNPTLSTAALDPATGTPVRTLKPEVPVDVMDDLRRGTMRGVRDKYGQGIKDAGTEAEKAFAHSEREAVTKAVDATVPAGQPNLSSLRGQEKELLDLSKSLVRRQTNAANANLFRLYEFLGLLSGNPRAVALGTVTRPWVASRTAIGMSDVGRAAQATNPTYVRAALLSLLNGQQE